MEEEERWRVGFFDGEEEEGCCNEGVGFGF